MYPGVMEIHQKIHQLGGKIMYISNNYRSVIENYVQTFGWAEFSEGFIGIEDVPKDQRKPHPGMILKALRQLKLKPKDCVMIGDSTLDIKAGQSAHVNAVAICTGNYKASQFKILQPNLILSAIAELLKKLPLNL